MNGHKQKTLRMVTMAILGFFAWSGIIVAAPAQADSVGCYPTLSDPCSDWTRVQSEQLVVDYNNSNRQLTVIIQRHYEAGYYLIGEGAAYPHVGFWYLGQEPLRYQWFCRSAEPLYLKYEFNRSLEWDPFVWGIVEARCSDGTTPSVMTGKTTRHQALQFCAERHKIAKRKKGRALKKALRNGTTKFRCVKPKRAHKRPFGS
ncbi:hypothetical protein KC952_01000 [Candidatus Saccharibacteria bacterium]|nr:hypothetical protein [Candidatus Saccharibacteria bacterium]